MMVGVSVIVPNYNHASFLKQRLDSVLNQTFQDFELIILDDCSTDNSREIIECYRNNSRVSHIIYNDKNSGSTFKQWQKGIELAQGEFIWIAESDDWATAVFLEKTVSILQRDKALGLVFCGSHWIDEDGMIGSDLSIHKHSFVKEGVKEIKDYLVRVNTVQNVSCVLFRKEFLKKASLSYLKYKSCGDWILYVEILQNSRIAFIEKKMNYFRFYHNNISNSASQIGLWEYERVDVLGIAKKNVTFTREEKMDLIGYWLKKIDLLAKTIPYSFRKYAYIHFKLFSFSPRLYIIQSLFNTKS